MDAVLKDEAVATGEWSDSNGGKTFFEKKKEIVINNYFKVDCDIDTSIRDAYVKGFERGLQKAPHKKRQGEWIRNLVCEPWRCSVCGVEEKRKRKFCPECGSDMRSNFVREYDETAEQGNAHP